MFLLLALAMPFFLYGEEPSIFTPTLSADALVSDDTVATTDSAGGTDLIVRPDTPEDLTVAADTLPRDVLEALLIHLQDLNATPSPARRAGGTVTLLDSSITVDQNGTPTKKMVYDYDERNRNYKTTTYFYTNGIPNGTSHVQEKVFDGTSSSSTILNTKYQWDATSSQWKGQSRTETVYDDTHHTISNVTYSWNPSYTYWTPTASTTYLYDALFRVPEQWTWTIDNSTKKLNPSTRTQQEWDDRNNLILKVVYKGGQNAHGEWLGGSGGTKNIYEYQTYGTANKKVLDEAYTWNTSLNQWVGKTSGKTTWEYTPNGSYETAKVIFNWNNTTLTYDTASATYKEYDAANHELSSFAYKWTNGVRAGNGTGTHSTYTGNNKDSVYSYTWRNGAWECTKIVIKLVNAANKVTVNETQNYNASGVGSGSGTYTYYAANNTTVTGTAVYTFANSIWTPKDSTAYIYIGSTKIADETYTWSTTLNNWVGKTHKEYFSGSGWTANITKTYNSSTETWVITSGSKTLSFTDTDGASGTITYTCNSDSIWQISTGSKSRSFTDLSGASVSLTWALNSDSVWSIKSGTRVPQNQKDARGNVILQSSYYCSTDSVWKVTSYTVWEYNSNNNQIYYAKFNKDSIPSDLSIAIYNSSGVKTKEEQYTWSNSQWTGAHCYVYGYAADSTTLISQTIYHGWNSTCNAWRGSSRSEWVYDISGQRVSQIDFTWNNNNCSWVYNIRHTFTYNTSGNVVTDIEERYSNNAWNNYQKKEYAYIGSTMTVNNTYNWQNNQWVLSLLNETTLSSGSSFVASEINATYQNGNISTHNETTYLSGTTLSKTKVSTTYNTDGTIATYELTTNYYNTEE